MVKSRIALVLLIGGLVWFSKDYLLSKKNVAVAQLETFVTAQQQTSESPPELQTFAQ